MQIAIDLTNIAKKHYKGTVEPYPATMTSRYMKGFGFPYEEWPQELKDEYVYNPMAAKKLLAEAGYPNGFKTNVVADTAVTSNCWRWSSPTLQILASRWKYGRWTMPPSINL